MNEGQLMGDFEMESKQLEAESWSRVVDSKFLKQQKKDVVKRQEVIYGESLRLLCWHLVAPSGIFYPVMYWVLASQVQVCSTSEIFFEV